MKVVHWRRNLFLLPFGKVEKAFLCELAKLLHSYANQSTYEGIALKASFLMQVLLLQKSTKTSKAKDHMMCLHKRLEHWRKGDIGTLLAEGRCIQAHLPNDRPKESSEMIPRVFSKMMFQGNVSGALNFLSRKSSGAPLKLNDIFGNERGEDVSVCDALMALQWIGLPSGCRVYIQKANLSKLMLYSTIVCPTHYLPILLSSMLSI